MRGCWNPPLCYIGFGILDIYPNDIQKEIITWNQLYASKITDTHYAFRSFPYALFTKTL